MRREQQEKIKRIVLALSSRDSQFFHRQKSARMLREAARLWDANDRTLNRAASNKGKMAIGTVVSRIRAPQNFSRAWCVPHTT
jgi:hypothetical protein